MLTLLSKDIGNRLKALRKGKELKQSEVAKHGRITANSLSAWERGEFTDIKVSHLLPVCQLLGVSVEKAITGHDSREEFEKEKLQEAIVMILNLYKDFLPQMTAEELSHKIMCAYHAESKDEFISSLETVFKR